MSDEQELPLPKVTPGLLRGAGTTCPRRLYAEFTGALGFGSEDPVNRARVRDALLDAIRTRHETAPLVGVASSASPVERSAKPPLAGSAPEIATFLEDEERAVIERALEWYQALFGSDPVESVELPLDAPTALPKRQVRLGGWVDLGVVHADGHRELRQLSLGRGVPADPLDEASVKLAVLRLVQARWITDETLTLSSADLLTGALSRRPLAIPNEIGAIGAWLDQELETVRGRTASPRPAPGRDCAQCRYVVGCEAHSVKGRMWSRKGDTVASILALTPTSLDTWHRCRREWRNREWGLPPSDPVDGASHGLLVHDLLRLIHHTGSCHDASHVNDVVAGHGSDPRVADDVRRHAERCPPDATVVGHELDWVRASGAPPPVFLATARLDAVWEHDGLLDVRDYKTGRPGEYLLREDRRARLQAWVAAAYAAPRGLRVRIRYEHLSGDASVDPDPWDPDDGELAAIEHELREVVTAMRAEQEFVGVREADVCRRCSYRSVCPDSAVEGEPSWPRPETAVASSP